MGFFCRGNRLVGRIERVFWGVGRKGWFSCEKKGILFLLFEKLSETFVAFELGVFSQSVIGFFDGCSPGEVALFLLDFMNFDFVCCCAFA